MIIASILGGLGNQMFQYAFIRALALRNSMEFTLDITGFEEYKLRDFGLDEFNIVKNLATQDDIDRLKRKSPMFGLFSKTYIKEKSLKFNPSLLKCKKPAYFQGYWQSEEYFKDFKDVIGKDFTFKNPLSACAAAILDDMSRENAVALHIRRGDYVKNALYNTDLASYYKNAISYIVQNTTEPVFYVFSDDENYAAAQFPDFKIVKGLKGIEDMRLMSLCRHNIIANSSFSWWGAWLNNNENKIVIAPKTWFNKGKLNSSTIVPRSWVQM